MEFDKEFCQEEERCGYTIPAEMKKVWSVQMDLMAQLDRVCREKGLTYFVSDGSLLGAIRHKGYIPWDDDIDVAMPRADYDTLLAECTGCFQEPYFLQHAFNDVNYSRSHAQLRNSETTAIIPSEKDSYVYNQGIFLDIFPMDEIPDDDKAYEAQCRAVRKWTKLLAATVRYPGSVKKNKVKDIIHVLTKPISYHWIYRQMEKACKKYQGQHTKRLAMISFAPGNARMVFPAACFAETLWVPFESTTVPVPKGYDEVLTIEYGDYMTMRHENSMHTGVLLDAERSYKEYLK